MINPLINEEKDLGTAMDLDADNYSKEENAKLIRKKWLKIKMMMR